MSKYYNFLIGTNLPEFSMPNDEGLSISNNELIGHWTVLFIYPKDNSPGCTLESCHFRNKYDYFWENNILLFGISTDTIESHKKFKEKNRLPYSLLSDKGAVFIKKLKLKKIFNFIRPRVTLIIDKEGIIRNVHSSQINMKGHITKTIKAFERLK
ncbi:MAG: peroxiredoxin [Euryarchaeota archaeon]|nr:peroxiredoxin [Euryarchaeota archaeon]